MTPRERVLATLNHREPDRVPVDLGGTTATTMSIGAYKQLRTKLGLPHAPLKLASLTSQLVDIAPDMLRRLPVDTRGVFPSTGRSWEFRSQTQDDYETFFDEWGVGFRRRIGENERYFDMCVHPLANATSLQDLENYRFPEGDDLFRIQRIRERCEASRQEGYPVIFGHPLGNGILHTGTRLMGYEAYYTKLLTDALFIEQLNERTLEVKMNFWDMVLSHLGDLLDIVYEMDDLGTQLGPLISPKAYRDHIKPFTATMCSFIKRKAPHIKILFHSCGSVVEFLPDFIEMGIDALNPIQTTAKGMQPETLKKEFGHDIVFWGGGIDTEQTLPFGTPEQVKAEIWQRLRVLSQGGGFVFATIHNIQPNVPPENILAMFEALQEFRS